MEKLSEAKSNSGRKKVLFIDDDPDYVKSVKLVLEKKYEVMPCFFGVWILKYIFNKLLIVKKNDLIPLMVHLKYQAKRMKKLVSESNDGQWPERPKYFPGLMTLVEAAMFLRLDQTGHNLESACRTLNYWRSVLN